VSSLAIVCAVCNTLYEAGLFTVQHDSLLAHTMASEDTEISCGVQCVPHTVRESYCTVYEISVSSLAVVCANGESCCTKHETSVSSLTIVRAKRESCCTVYKPSVAQYINPLLHSI